MKDRTFVLLFILGYFLSFDAAMIKPKAGGAAFFASITGLTTIALTQDYKKTKS